MTNNQKKYSPIQLAVMAIVIFAAAAGGIYLGGLFSQKDSDPAQAETDAFQSLALKPGLDFPSIILFDRHLTERDSRSLLDGAGTVVLFVEYGCQPCEDMAATWKAVLDRGELDPAQIIGITYSDAERMEELMAEHGLKISVYEDQEKKMMTEFGVDAFPLMLIVDRHGVIQYSSWNINYPIDDSKLKELMTM